MIFCLRFLGQFDKEKWYIPVSCELFFMTMEKTYQGLIMTGI